MDKETAKLEVEKIVKKFQSYSKEKLDGMPEEDIKFQFIEPLLEALGWKREDISKEYRVLKGRADYLIKIGNQNKLVVEAKKTSVRLSEEEGRQAVSYAHHKNIKFSVLTNFKQIRVYHALSNIKNIDKNLLKDDKGYLWLDCENFIKDFDRLWLLSKESFEKEEINDLLQNVDKKLIKPIDEAILTDLLQYREWLSKDLKSKRTYLEDSQIDEVVQILIDRLIFMRSVEDRGLEEEDFLLNIIKKVEQGQTDKNLWALLLIQFKIFDKEYNSKLFSEGILEKEGFFDERTLIKVIKGLYYGTQDHQERYRFDDLPVDLLGNIYEQYLGVVLRGTEKRVKLDLLSRKRKKMGIYYTPKYIVDYILDSTLVEYAKDKTLDEILDIKVIDPACGSGSFLLDAFEELKKIIEDRLKNGEKSKKWDSFKDFKGRLSLGQKATILLNCIYGVDLDEKAVELTQLNLLLKILEEETRETRRRILPNMKDNIKNGNSLISDSHYDKAFNWQAQFPDVFRQGGFDVVIGNPPYVRIQTLSRRDVKYFNENYNSPHKNYDIYLLFVEKGYNLLKEEGSLGFILPHKFFQGEMGVNLRSHIYQTKSLSKIIDFTTNQIFENATTYTCLLFLKKKRHKFFGYKKFELGENFKDLMDIKFEKLDIEILKENQWNFSNQNVQNILRKITSQKDKFSEITKKIFKGSSTGNDKIFLLKLIGEEKDKMEVFSEELRKEILLEKKILVPFIYGEDVRKYQKIESKKLLLFPYEINKGKMSLIELKKLKSEYPLTYDYFSKVKDKLMERKLNFSNTNFYKYSAGRSLIEYQQSKIMIPDMLVKIRVGYDKEGIYYHGPAIHSVVFKEKYNKVNPLVYLAILNSKLFWFFISNTSTALRGNTYRLTPEFLNNFCFPDLTQIDEKQSKKIKELVERIIQFYKEGKSEQDINNVDYEIDEEIYKLYGITKEEQKIIGESIK